MPVVGRFAPSPTGALHLGSLLAAVASFVDARAQGGRWHLRIDDVDCRRVVPGAARRIVDTLTAFGLRWDGPVIYQSQRFPAYAYRIELLRSRGAAFDCGCTRVQARTGPLGMEGPIYPGTCRRGLPSGQAARSVRLRVDSRTVAFDDAICGRQQQNLARDVGDFLLHRADGVPAYQLATVVDDHFQGVTDVVRGADLLTSTPRQLYIGRCLGWAAQRYAHVPLLQTPAGDKLCKSSGAPPLEPTRCGRQIWRCLKLLGQKPSPRLVTDSPQRVLDHAIQRWDRALVPKVAQRLAD